MVVLFVDMDYFFAACEELRRPELKGKPFVVGTHPEKDKFRGVVQTCNYEARKYGVHSAMSINKALELCKDLVYVPDDYKYYDEMSAKVMKLIRGYSFPVEQDSVDEAAVDLGKISYENAKRTGEEIKRRINAETGLPCTIGISYGKYLAKMVCDASKPNGFGIVTEKEMHAFLDSKPVGKLPGVGEKTEAKLKSIGITTVGELAKVNPVALIDKFGSAGVDMQQLAKGVDDGKVVSTEETLSIGRQSTLYRETGDIEVIGKKLKELSDDVAKESARKEFMFKNVGVMVRYSDFTQVTKAANMTHYSSSSEDIYKMAISLAKDLINGKIVRKVGVRVSALLTTKGQKALF